jgi:hypothetical protein
LPDKSRLLFASRLKKSWTIDYAEGGRAMRERVPMQQVVMRRDGGPIPRFELRDNPLNRAPLSFEEPAAGFRIPRLGSQDILGIAAFALRNGFRIDNFVIEDQTFTRIDDDIAEEVSADLLRALTEKGPAAAATLIDRDWGYYVTGIVLTTPDLHTISLLRQGVTRTSDRYPTDAFLASAWQAVHFS